MSDLLEAVVNNESLTSVEPSEFIEFTDSNGNWIKYKLYKQGHWEDYQMWNWIYVRCSECRLTFDAPTNYCPNCGAQMDGDSK